MRLRNYVIYAIENDFTIDIRVYEKDAVTRVCTWMIDRTSPPRERRVGVEVEKDRRESRIEKRKIRNVEHILRKLVESSLFPTHAPLRRRRSSDRVCRRARPLLHHACTRASHLPPTYILFHRDPRFLYMPYVTLFHCKAQQPGEWAYSTVSSG